MKLRNVVNINNSRSHISDETKKDTIMWRVSRKINKNYVVGANNYILNQEANNVYYMYFISYNNRLRYQGEDLGPDVNNFC